MSGVEAGAQAVTAPGDFTSEPREYRNFGATMCGLRNYLSRGIALQVCLTMKDPSLSSQSEMTLPKVLATRVPLCENDPWQWSPLCENDPW